MVFSLFKKLYIGKECRGQSFFLRVWKKEVEENSKFPTFCSAWTKGGLVL